MSENRVVGAALIALTLTTTVSAQYVPPYNLVVVVLDSSISFQVASKEPGTEGRVPVTEALSVVQRLLSESSAERRRRNAHDDRYVIVAADAASQVIWSGNRADLGSFTADALLAILKVRRQFAHCTDYEAAFNAATRVMHQHADASDMYVLTFGDLLHDPPTTSYRTCAGATGQPPAAIDWDTLSHAALGFYFVSTDFTLRPNRHWSDRLESIGANAEFRDMAQTLTQPLQLPPPPQAVYRPTEGQVREAQERMIRLKTFGSAMAKWSAISFGLLTMLLFWFIRRARGRVAATRTVPGGRHA
jgi:hypothetical protein